MPVNFISFDFWNTLYKSNPKFSKIRDACFEPEIKEKYRQTKDFLDKLAEISSIALSSYNCYKLLTHGTTLNTQIVQTTLMEEFHKNPPIIGKGLRELIAELKGKGYVLAIASNTNFASGVDLRKIIEKEFGDAFSQYAFSDEFGIAKPRLLSELYAGYPYSVLHVGDHPVCDGRGCDDAGIKFLKVDHPDETASKLIDYLSSQQD